MIQKTKNLIFAFMLCFVYALNAAPPVISGPPTTPCNALAASSAGGMTASGVLKSYDGETYGGSIASQNSNPPFAPNLVYYVGTTTNVNFAAGVPAPTCGTTAGAPKRLFYSFVAPSIGNIGVTLRANYPTTNKATIIEVLSATSCSGTFSVVKCSTADSLVLTPADLTSHLGQTLYVQVTENSAANTGMNFMLSIEGNVPAISIDSINTNGMRVILPATTPTNLSHYKIYYRPSGSTGYATALVSSSATSFKLKNLVSGINYDIWVSLYSATNTQVFCTPLKVVSTISGCAGSLPAPTAITAPLPNTSCTKVLVTWPSFANAGTDQKYRLYYGETGSSGYTIMALNDTSVLLNLLINKSYFFYYRAICQSGFALLSGTTTKITCGVTTPPVNILPCFATSASSANGSTAVGELRAYDKGVYGGSISSPNSNPPYAPNLVYYIANTIYAAYAPGAPAPTCGTPASTPKRAYYSFRVPSIGDVGITLRTKYVLTSGTTILEAMTATGSPCPTTFNIIKCSSNDSLILTAADLLPYQGQIIYIQITENSTANAGINYMLSIQANAPNFTIDSVNTNGMRVVMPSSPPSNLNGYTLYYRQTGNTGYSYINLPASTSSYKLTDLLSNVSYDVWLAYNSSSYSQTFISPTKKQTTQAGCSGTLPSPTAATAPSPNTSCTKVLVKWPSFANAGTSYKYRIYWRETGSSGYSLLSLNDTFITLTLSLNTSYDFFYKAVCPTNYVLSSTTSMLVTCGTPKTSSVITSSTDKKITIKGISYSLNDFIGLALATEGTVPTDGNIHNINLEGDQAMNIASSIQVFPNPASEYVEVEYIAKADVESSVRIVGLDGRIIDTKVLSTENQPLIGDTNFMKMKTRMDLSETPHGMYIVQVIQDGNVETRQLVVFK
ncbi:MAG: T9SS type A sorting domain-containing protein [Bacteroidetes bacterium]|nr:T9SS type A sorting domain-containing protein [Bacteroidota bacterium]